MGVKYTDVIERMRGAANLKNDSRVAHALSVTPQALSNYKKRGSIPSDLIFKFADIYGLSVDWILTGNGPMQRPKGAAEEVSPYSEEVIPAMRTLKEVASLTPEEIICVGKLLRVLREGDESTVSVLKWSVEAFIKAIEAPKEGASEKSGN